MNLTEVRAKGVELYLDGDLLKYKGTKDIVTLEFIQELKKNKSLWVRQSSRFSVCIRNAHDE
jgi:hypothetical protein